MVVWGSRHFALCIAKSFPSDSSHPSSKRTCNGAQYSDIVKPGSFGGPVKPVVIGQTVKKSWCIHGEGVDNFES